MRTTIASRSDELARIIDPIAWQLHDAYPDNTPDLKMRDYFAARSRGTVEQILSAGWRPPAPVLTTPEDMESVPIAGIVRTSAGTIACRLDRDRGVLFGDDRPIPWEKLRLPATLLWSPEDD